MIGVCATAQAWSVRASLYGECPLWRYQPQVNTLPHVHARSSTHRPDIEKRTGLGVEVFDTSRSPQLPSV